MYESLVSKILESPDCQEVRQKGWCRRWSRCAYLVLKEWAALLDVQLEIEAREVDVELYLSHTFLRLVLPGEQPYLLDGTGIGSYEPYFGYEAEAPEHLKNSTWDPLNHYFD
jgi:hypothetical protein